jgi:hypothetical protein
MKKDDVIAYRDRWRAVADIELHELRLFLKLTQVKKGFTNNGQS